jgi:cytochrome o ubiquinol oxidase subunit 2
MDKKPLTIQVVALQWKWLFIYPEQNIASVNFFQIPTHTPINFEITADAPMNSFWLPQIAGQIYAMPGMRTKLHLVADEEGQYRGSSANLSGRGFAGMTFIAQASTEADFDKWVESVAQSTKSLDVKEYEQLAEPSENNPVVTFQVEGKGLFDQIIMKYMMPS